MAIDINTMMLLAIAICNVIIAVLAWHTKQDVAATRVTAERTELNTNSMREALVQRTGEAEHAKGREEARKEGETKAAELAETAEVRLAASELPVPVTDNRVAESTEAMAASTEKMAEATTKLAEAADRRRK